MDATETVIDVKEAEQRDKNLKDLQALFRPYGIVQALFMLSKYKLKNNSIKPNSTFYNISSAIFSVALLLCHDYLTFRPFYVDEWDATLLAKYVCAVQESPLMWFGALMNVCTNIVYTQNNVVFAARIQNVCRILRNNGSSINTFIIMNWCNIISVIGFQVSWILIFNYAFSSIFHTYELLGNLMYIIFDTNIVYTIALMRFLSKAFRSWIDMSKKCHPETNFNSRDFWNKMFRDYVDIYEAYEIAAEVLNPLILFCYIKTFIHTLFGILFRVEAGKVITTGMVRYTLTAIISMFWLYKDVTLFIVLSLECEKLYTKMEEVKNICIKLAASERCSDTQQKACKNIVRHQIVSFKKMKVCGLFAVDAALMMHFAGLITRNIIIVFQFEFL